LKLYVWNKKEDMKNTRSKVDITFTTARSIFKHLMNYQMLIEVLTCDKNDPRYKWMSDLRGDPEAFKLFVDGLAMKKEDVHLRRDIMMTSLWKAEVKDGVVPMEPKEKAKFLKSRPTRSCG